jgi:hypothetical protein
MNATLNPQAIAPEQFLETMREAKAKAEAAVQPPKKDAPDPKRARLYTFEFAYEDPHGKVWGGTFTNSILTIAQRVGVGTVRARMQAGVPVDALTDATFELIYMLSWMQHSFTQTPKWAEDLPNLLDEELIQALYTEVRAHEETFRQRKPAKATSEEQPS